jgi:exodeoxyribonuclease VII small subunit
MAKKKIDTGFEEKLARIKQLADKLQHDELGLDESMALFTEADALLQECRVFLEAAELKIEQLINPAAAGH